MSTLVRSEVSAEACEIRVSEVLFDMDGTLVDSIPAVEHAWREWAGEEGHALPDALSFHGRTARELVRAFVPEHRVSNAVDRLNELESTSTQPVPAMRGALALLSHIPEDRWSIVTSAAREVARARIAAGGIPVPQHLVTGDDVTLGKPSPEPFLQGKRHGGTAIAFEDTVAGLRSARAAGCITVGVVGTHLAADLYEHADYVIADLTAVTVAGVHEDGVTIRIVLGTTEG